MSNKEVYLDHAATAPLNKVVLEHMKPYFYDNFYNPSSLYSAARNCAKAVSESRDIVASWFNAKDSREVIFTSGGSESDNAAIYGICMANKDKGKHIISIPIEHHAVLHTLEGMKSHGFDFTLVPVDKYGIIDLEALKKSIRKDTVLITVMYANNEIGSIQPIKEIGQIAKEHGVFFHTDAVQAAGVLPIDVRDMNIDALSISAHKFYGPKGAGVLYLKNGMKFEPLIKGGAQEYNRRAGTNNVPGIVGLAKALDIAYKDADKNNKRIIQLRNDFVEKILENIPDTIYNGHPNKRLPNNTNFCFKFIESEAILLHLDMMGIYASSGSACSTGDEDPSHVLAAIGLPRDIARGSVRFTLGNKTTSEDIDYVVQNIKKIITKLRQMSPLSN